MALDIPGKIMYNKPQTVIFRILPGSGWQKMLERDG
jgi:hypothetical protein